ncbi:hypothetical protein ABBQ32_004980 [Trebouxia sp. C0010 RCD-2024]
MSHSPSLVQRPSAGPFDKTDLQWVPRRISKGANKDQLVQKAYILADRCDDFLQGESTRGQTQYSIAKREKNEPGSLKRPQVNSFPCQDTYQCSDGPEDFRACLPEALTQQDRLAHSRVSKKHRGLSCKRGCLQQFTVSKLYVYSAVAQLSMKHSEHTDAAGIIVHGSQLALHSVRELHAPRLSDEMKDWITIKLNDCCTTQQILKQHAKAVEARIAAGENDQDCFLTGQNIRNIEQKLAKGTRKLHDNEAQSVRLFYQQHSDKVFIYVEESSAAAQLTGSAQATGCQPSADTAQPADGAQLADTAQLQTAQKFVMGRMTSFMMNNLLKFGKNNVVLLDATFGTNHLKMPLYPLRVLLVHPLQ